MTPIKQADELATTVERLRELDKAATPGPWYTLGPPWLPSDSETSILAGSPDPHVARFICDFDMWALDDEADVDRKSENPDADAALIVALRNNLPAILAALRQPTAAAEGLRELKREIKELRRALEPWVRVARLNMPLSEHWPDDSPAITCIPGGWPTWGDLKRADQAYKGDYDGLSTTAAELLREALAKKVPQWIEELAGACISPRQEIVANRASAMDRLWERIDAYLSTTPPDLTRNEALEEAQEQPIHDFIFDWFNERDPDAMRECLEAYRGAALKGGDANEGEGK